MSTLTAFAVLKAPGGFVAYRLSIPQKGPITRQELCEPCHRALAYQYLMSKLAEQQIADTLAEANATGQKAPKDV